MVAVSYAFRLYQPQDRPRLLEIFRGNTPEWFAAHEIEQFEAFLDDEPGQYFVMTDEAGVIVGSGGISIEASRRSAWLTWGMVEAALHGKGLGRLQLEHRLELLRANPNVDRVCIDTSHKSAPFFEKCGFAAQRIIPDGYAKGLHRHEMELSLTQAGRPANYQ